MSIKVHDGWRIDVASMRSGLSTMAASLRPLLHSVLASSISELVAEARTCAYRAAVLGDPSDFGALADLSGGHSLGRAPVWREAQWFLAREAHRCSAPVVRRSPATDLTLGLRWWTDPTDASKRLVLPVCERDELVAAAMDHLGATAWGYWDHADPDEDVPEHEWAARKASWEGSGRPGTSQGWSLPVFSEILTCPDTVLDDAAAHLLDAKADELCLSGLDDALAEMLAEPMAMPASPRAEVMAERVRERAVRREAANAAVGPLFDEHGDVSWSKAMLLTRAHSLIERDQEWEHLLAVGS